jgi:hypothetical protein
MARRDYVEPFSDEARALYEGVSDVAQETLEQAFNDARAPYGDEGAGYDIGLMAARLEQLGWTPPEDTE